MPGRKGVDERVTLTAVRDAYLPERQWWTCVTTSYASAPKSPSVTRAAAT
jgi:hypothetical protein